MSEFKQGQRGTLTSKDGKSALVGTVEFAYDDGDFAFRVDGTACSNTFEQSEWDWAPDLPSVDNLSYGLYQVTRYAEGADVNPIEHAVIYRHTESGGWVYAVGNKPIGGNSHAALERALNEGRLARLVRTEELEYR